MPPNQNKEEKSCRLQLPTLPCPGGNVLLAFVAPTQNTPFLQYLKAINPSRANLEIQANIPVRGRRTDVHSPSTRPRSQGRRVCFVTSAATLLLIPHRGHHSRTNEHRPDRMDHRVPIPVWAVDRPIVTLVVLEAKESAQWRSVLEAFLFRHPIPLTATQPFTRCPPSSSSCPTPHTTKRLLQPASPCPHRLTRGKSEKKKNMPQSSYAPAGRTNTNQLP